MTAKISTKTGKNFRGGGGIFWLARIYTPVGKLKKLKLKTLRKD